MLKLGPLFPPPPGFVWAFANEVVWLLGGGFD